MTTTVEPCHFILEIIKVEARFVRDETEGGAILTSLVDSVQA